MKIVKLQINEFDSYKVIYQNDKDLWGLADFLTFLLRTDYNYFMDWLTGKLDQEWAYGDWYGLEELNGRVYVGTCCDTEEERYQSFSTTKENMIKIINDWKKVAYKDPKLKTILITQESEEVTITAQD